MHSRRKRRIIAITAIVIIVLMVLGMLAPVLRMGAASVASLDRQYTHLKTQEAALERQQKEIASKIKSNKNDQKTVVAQLQNIEANISVIKQQMDLMGNRIDDCGAQIFAVNARIAVAQKRVEKNTELYKERIRTIYEVGGTSSRLQMFFESKSVTDFLSRLSLMKVISDHDNALITQLKADKQAIVRDKAALVTQKNSLLLSQQRLSQTKIAYNAQSRQQKTLFSQLKNRAATLNQLDDEMDGKEAELNKKLGEIIRQKEAAAQQQGSGQYVGGTWLWPIQGFSNEYISSPFGPRAGHKYPHTGIDIAGGGIFGHEILASNSGTVLIAGYDDSGIYGNYIVLDHGGGMTTLYGHCCRLNCTVGQKVERGQVIGYVGSTGHSTGPHLHFQIMVNGTAVNPINYVRMP